MQNRNALKYLFLANIISGFAQGISMLAIPWYFQSVLNEESLFGMIYAGATLFTMVWSLYSGLLVDRYSRKSNFFFINLIGGVVLLGIATTGFVLGAVPMPLIAAVFVTTMLVYNIHYPALYAFAQEVSRPDDYGRVNSYIEIQGQSTSVISGAFAALLISGTKNGHINLMGFDIAMPFNITPWTLQEIFMLNAATYFLALICIALIKYKPHTERVIDTGTLYERLKAGFTYLTHHKNISVFGQASFMVFVVLIVEVHFLLPSYINNHLKLSADVYASAEIYYAIGALFAGFAIRRLFVNTNEVKAVIILMFLAAVFFFMASVTNSLLLFFFISVMFGVTNAGIRVLRITWLFNHVPNNVIGRTNSIFNMSNIFLRATLTSIFALPFFAQGNNVVWAYAGCAFFVLVWIVPLLVRYRRIVDNKKIDMKKLLLVFILTANYCSAQVGEKVFFIDKNNEYSVLIKPMAKIKYDTLQGTIPATSMIFFNVADSSYKYNLMIIKADTAFNNITDGYVTDVYADVFKSTCKCTVVESKKVVYANFKAYQFVYTRNGSKSYYNFIAANNYIYTLNAVFTSTDFDKYKDEYNSMLNTLVFNQ